ncbi:MAG TPA: exosortase/archaeosortase family protein [Gemmataceae bacterium]|nr:exosortase/archaeosortase family protein [Gemmataceae bacterium]
MARPTWHVPMSSEERRYLTIALSLSALTLVWAYWTSLADMAWRWSHDPQYAHGYLVPGFAAVLLWLRRDRLATGRLQPCWQGVPVLAFGIGLRLFGAYFHYVWLDAVSFLPCLAGVWLLIGGKTAWRWGWPAIAFLGFMVPLPYGFSLSLAAPLQRLATIASTFALQTLGMPAVADGNVILLEEVEVNVVEACSGLRMLVVFFAFATAVALIVKRPLWEKLFLLISAIPIALVVNVMRITATGVLYELVNGQVAKLVFHDLAGWLMMPVALGILGLELQFLKRLVIDGRQPSGSGQRLAASSR